MADTIHIDSMAFGGAGVGRTAAGKVVFVRGGAPGDLLRLRDLVDRRSFAEAEVEAVLEPSADRVEPPCELSGRCGGCPWMHVSVGSQRSWKGRLLAAELVRAGLIPAPELLPPVVGGEPLGHRTRTRLHRRAGRFGTMGRRSSTVLELRRCPVLAPELEAFASELGSALASMPAGDADLELYVDAEGRRGLLVEPRGPAAGPRWERLAAELGTAAFRVLRGRRRARPSGPPLHEASLGFRLAFEPGVFVQSNRAMNQELVARALAAAGCGRRFVEVYAGAGNFTVHLARAFERGEASESDPLASRCLVDNLAAAGGRVVVRRERDEAAARRLVGARAADLLLADPPRAGMRPLEPLLDRAPPRRVVMISCHPMAAVRDLVALGARGYRLESVEPIDMFPQTDHLELVACLSRA